MAGTRTDGPMNAATGHRDVALPAARPGKPAAVGGQQASGSGLGGMLVEMCPGC